MPLKEKLVLTRFLHSFQQTVNEFEISDELIAAFFKSMESDLAKSSYNRNDYSEYIYGSAEVVGLMCLFIFCEGDEENFEKLKPYAQSLGAAFQKVNFLRDVKNDLTELDRTYFPDVDFNNFTASMKQKIEAGNNE